LDTQVLMGWELLIRLKLLDPHGIKTRLERTDVRSWCRCKGYLQPLSQTVGLLELSVGKLVEFIGRIEFELGALSDRKMKRFVRAVSLRS